MSTPQPFKEFEDFYAKLATNSQAANPQKEQNIATLVAQVTALNKQCNEQLMNIKKTPAAVINKTLEDYITANDALLHEAVNQNHSDKRELFQLAKKGQLALYIYSLQHGKGEPGATVEKKITAHASVGPIKGIKLYKKMRALKKQNEQLDQQFKIAVRNNNYEQFYELWLQQQLLTRDIHRTLACGINKNDRAEYLKSAILEENGDENIVSPLACIIKSTVMLDSRVVNYVKTYPQFAHDILNASF